MLSSFFPTSCGPGLRSSQNPQCQRAQQDPQASGSWPFSMKSSKNTAAWSNQLSAFREKLSRKHEEIALLRAKQRDIKFQERLQITFQRCQSLEEKLEVVKKKLQERLQITFQRCQSLEEKLEVVKKKLAAPREDGAGNSAAGEWDTGPSPSPRALPPAWKDEREVPMATLEDTMDIRHIEGVNVDNSSDRKSSDVNCSAKHLDSCHGATEQEETDCLGPHKDFLGPGLQRFHHTHDLEAEHSPLDVAGLRQFGKTAAGKYELAKKQVLLKGTQREGLPSTPFTQWDAASVAFWMEHYVRMPACSVSACKVKAMDGALMISLSDSKLKQKLHLRNCLQVLKLRLAIEEVASMSRPSAPASRRRTSIIASGIHWANKLFNKPSLPEVEICPSSSLPRLSTPEDMSHEWICWEWLPSLGLPQYCSYFLEGLVDSRMLSHLTEDILRRELKMAKKFHRNSFMCGVSCLQKFNYDRKLLERRRLESQHVLKDVVVWSNERITCWVQSIGLSHYARNLAKSGLHGAVIALEDSFNCNILADILKIPKKDTEAHSILRREFNELLLKGTERRVGEDRQPGSDEDSTESLWGPPEDSDLQPLLLVP